MGHLEGWVGKEQPEMLFICVHSSESLFCFQLALQHEDVKYQNTEEMLSAFLLI